MRRIVHPLAAALVVASALTGCTLSAPDSPTASRTPAASATVTADAPGLPAGVAQASDVPTAVANDPAQRSNVTVTGCSRTDAGWAATGTAKNPTGEPVTYRLTLFFTTATATVLAVAPAEVPVKAGGDATWRAEAAFTAPDGTRCVLAGVAAR
jgi:hypothetical protein